MDTPAPPEAAPNLKYLELEFSGTVCGGLPQLLTFALRRGIGTLRILVEDDVEPELLTRFCAQAKEAGMTCSVVLPPTLRGVRGELRSKDIGQAVVICGDAELHDFFAERELFPDAEVELRCGGELWNVAAAMAECADRGIPCRFGCSEAFFRASAADIAAVCGGDLPFPGGRACLGFAESVFIDRTGRVFACRGLRDLPVGSIFDEDFQGIVETSSILDYYRSYTRKIKEPCRSCPAFGPCAGCRGRAYRYSADFLGADPGCPRNADKLDKVVKLPVRDPEHFIPHQGSMLLVSELISVTDNACEAAAVVREDNPFLTASGLLDPAAFIEIGAQGMALLDGFINAGAEMRGMLVEVSRFEYSGLPVPPGTRLLIFGNKICEMPPWSVGTFKIVSSDGGFIAAGEVKVCQFQEPQ